MFSFSWFSCAFPKTSAALIDLSSVTPLIENPVDISGISLLEKQAENLVKEVDEQAETLIQSNINSTYTYFTTINSTETEVEPEPENKDEQA